MNPWLKWFQNVAQLREACSRSSTFAWMVLVLVGFSVRLDKLGVTSFVRALAFEGRSYHRFLHLFHSNALCLERLTRLWVILVLKMFRPLTIGDYAVCIADGLKVAKEGRRMPAVKKLHQESQNNSKSPFIMGHSFQAISLLVSGFEDLVLAVPLTSRIHEGLIFSNRDQRSLLDKLASLFLSVAPILDRPLILVADAFYASKKIVKPLLRDGHHLVTRVRRNAVAYRPARAPKKPRRGRRKIYGRKISLKKAAQKKDNSRSAQSPLHGESSIRVQYRCLDLLWRPIGQLVRFVIVDHPLRGQIILMSTNRFLDPMEILLVYGHRFKIEQGFRQAIHTLAAYGYHFWMKAMVRIRRCSGEQYLHRKSEKYRAQVLKKLNAYHIYVQLGCIAQGLMINLAVDCPKTVWRNFRSWFRTMDSSKSPSELVVAHSLRSGAHEFLHDSCPDTKLRKIFRRYRNRKSLHGWQLSA